ncbi:L,D-transpeptidase family protein [Paenibacillus validus]|uniref:L,D-transpeptidase family protein n=4 Tax=Paenibacillus TaxID=44249 RepID=A0A7X3CT53_9BACL|nr:L,D-transpeptidase family protein [Paenibacillus validus]
MAWYLLGREYEEQGKQGKALYCYAQAGEVYEAYEEQKVVLPAEEAASPGPSKPPRASRRWGIRFMRLAVAMLALGAALLSAPGLQTRTVEELAQPAAVVPADVTPAQIQATRVYYLAGTKTPETIGQALQHMLLLERVRSFGILVRGIPLSDSTWIEWLRKPETLLSVEAESDASRQQILYHDAESCQCEPSDAQRADGVVAAWMSHQEQQAVLRSAVAAYIRRTGQAPTEASQLTASYPDNVLPGLTPYMSELFARDSAAIAQEMQGWNERSAAQAGGSSQGQTPPGELPEGLIQPLAEPLEIKIDKTAHRLAVVSGSIVVREYPVGLGGSRTPEGSFVISEKVRNPNGQSDGDFGSRGMTLSDTLYAIHGTNKPKSIGKDQSLGCVRMRQTDVEELFDMAPLGTKVTIGRGLLPAATSVSATPLKLPAQADDTNPNKVYKWLD